MAASNMEVLQILTKLNSIGWIVFFLFIYKIPVGYPSFRETKGDQILIINVEIIKRVKDSINAKAVEFLR